MVTVLTLGILTVLQFSICMEHSMLPYEIIYDDIIWIGQWWCLLAASFVAVVNRYDVKYVLLSYLAIYGYRISQTIQFDVGGTGQLFKAMVIGTIFAFAIIYITDWMISALIDWSSHAAKETDKLES